MTKSKVTVLPPDGYDVCFLSLTRGSLFLHEGYLYQKVGVSSKVNNALLVGMDIYRLFGDYDKVTPVDVEIKTSYAKVK